MVHPDVTRPKYRNGVSVRHGSPSVMRRRATNLGISGRYAVVYVNSVDYDVGDVLKSKTCAMRDMNFGASSVDGLEAIHDQLLLQRDHHVVFKYNPKRLHLDDRMS